MDPVLKRLGDVTIQRLEKPKDPKVGPQSVSNPLETSKESIEEPTESEEENDDQFPIPQLKRNLPESQHSMKKFKFDSGDITLAKKCDDINQEIANVNNFSDEGMSDFEEDEIESEIESDTDLNDLINAATVDKSSSISTKEETSEDEVAGASFLDKLVEEPFLQSPPSVTASKSSGIQDSGQDEDYDYDIKEKLKEMGEISFETVKKGDKPKKAEIAENEVVVTPAKKPGITDEELANLPKGVHLRRNIREVMDETKLDEATLAAQREEAERVRRVVEQQKFLREYQKQANQERMQQKVISLLQGNNYNKPGTSQTPSRIGNTVLVKLPNGQTKSMTKLPKKPFDMVRMQKGPVPQFPMGPGSPLSVLGAPKGRSLLQKRSGSSLTPSVSIAPVNKKYMGDMMVPKEEPTSGSDSDMEDMKRPPPKRKSKDAPVATIDISSDDDCIVVSEPEGDQDDNEDDPGNSGMHTNDEFNVPDEQGRILVNVGHPEDDPDVFVAPQIARIIKPHQVGGIRFLYDNLIESTNRFDSSTGFGCILAHSMGLGKTLQIVTFSDIFLRNTAGKTVLCIMPINTLQNWMAEFNMWLPSEEAAVNSPLNSHGEVRPRNFSLYVLNDSHKTLAARARVIHDWKTIGGVLMIGYEMYRLLCMKKHPKSRKKATGANEPPEDNKNKALFDEVYDALVHPGPDLVICDEGHRIKNSHASISLALKQMKTKRRVVLTGYPLQNNLMEYWCMVDFVRPNYLGTKTEFCNMFERPIMNGQCIDSTEADIKLMRYRAHVLHSLLLGFVQRRSHTVLQTALPQKNEYVLLCRMTPFQRTLYETFMNEVVRTQAVPNPLKAFAVCCKIWNHPDVLYNFLKKRARSENAVDIDLEEVAGAMPTKEVVKPKKGTPGRKKAPPKGKNGKATASVTPYNSLSESNPVIPQESSQNSGGPLASFASAALGGSKSNLTPPNKPFQSPSYTENPYYDQHFDQNAQFPTNFNNKPNDNFQLPYPESPQSSGYQSNNHSNFNLNQHLNQAPNNSFNSMPPTPMSTSTMNASTPMSTNTNSNMSTISNLSSEISLTPVKRETQNTLMQLSNNSQISLRPKNANSTLPSELQSHLNSGQVSLTPRNQLSQLDQISLTPRASPAPREGHPQLTSGQVSLSPANQSQLSHLNSGQISLTPLSNSAQNQSGNNYNYNQNQQNVGPDRNASNQQYNNQPNQQPNQAYNQSQPPQQNYNQQNPNQQGFNPPQNQNQQNYNPENSNPPIKQEYNTTTQQNQGQFGYPPPQPGYSENQPGCNAPPTPNQPGYNNPQTPNQPNFNATETPHQPGYNPPQNQNYNQPQNQPNQPQNPSQNDQFNSGFNNQQNNYNTNYNNQPYNQENPNYNQPGFNQNQSSSNKGFNQDNTGSQPENQGFNQNQQNYNQNSQNPPYNEQNFSQPENTAFNQQNNYNRNEQQNYDPGNQPNSNYQQNSTNYNPNTSQNFNQSPQGSNQPPQQGQNQPPSYNSNQPPQNSNFNTFNNEQSSFQQNQSYWNQNQSPQQNFGDFNQPNQQFNTNYNSSQPWIKKEDPDTPPKANIISNQQLTSPMSDSKPKIKILSDIKLPPVFPNVKKRIEILSDIKLEPKTEDMEDKFDIKKEIGFIKNEVKSEFKNELKDDFNPFSSAADIPKLNSLMALKDKEDSGIPYDWAIELLRDYIPGCIENSAKMRILFCIIRESISLKDRLLVFSQSLITLDLIEQFLQQSLVPGDTVKWARNTSYYRLDGSTSALEREKLINEFNSNPKIHVFLVSTRAGSLGINLIGANRVVVLDASWNPCHDTQAVCRVYRYGQRKPCFVYRLVVDNCLEKKIYDRQVNKQGMSDRIVDECNPDAHLTMKDVSTLCWDDHRDEGEEKDWSCVKDRYIDVVLQKVLENHGRMLNKEPFQHESLLVDRKEKQLSSQEKRLAKKGYEREKNASRQPSYYNMMNVRGIHRPVASVRPMQQGERPSRWIPAEHWQRQGMTAQEMTLPLDVVIPTNQPEKGNIVLKAGQKVLVLKSPKGVYMQLESGKIVAIKTAIKVKGKAEDNNDPMKMITNKPPLPVLPPTMKVHPNLSGPKKIIKPFQPGVAKFNVKSIRQSVPNLVSRIQSVTKKVQMAKTKPYNLGSEIAKSLKEPENSMPGSSSEDEHANPNPLMASEKPKVPPMVEPPRPSASPPDEIQKQLGILKSKHISIQRVSSNAAKTNAPPVVSATSAASALAILGGSVQVKPVMKEKKLETATSALEQLEHTASLVSSDAPFQETLDSITSGYKNVKISKLQTIDDHLDNLENLEHEIHSEEEPEEEIEEEEEDPSVTDLNKSQSEISDHSDEVTYVSEQSPAYPPPTPADPSKPETSTEYPYNNYYNYPYGPPPHPPPQGYAYPPQPPPYDMMGYQGQPQYNYGYHGYPPQPQYPPPPPPQGGYDYNASPQPMYPGYQPYPQTYAPPPPAMYAPPPATSGAPPYQEYQYPPTTAPPTTQTYYPPT